MKVVALSSSPRRDGNSWALAQAAGKGVREAGHELDFVHLTDYVQRPLGDCRQCRLSNGSCSVDDDYERLLLDHVLPADAIIYATPLHWYGMTGRLKDFFDRLFCYTSASSPHAEVANAGLMHKRAAVLISCEESYRGATLGLEAQFQELTRYLRQDLVGVVVGVGNSRGEVERDPARPLEAAADLGRRLFDIHVTDYRLDTERSNRVWSPAPPDETY
ncbi:NAD(P)H-dependent oxidoreductase [Amycolatopsis granulosa]|uniref:NAD(P)H-dependent oxidoreductase n=1 Tax=Amycolatopsis granulosa TaxID=185684 RepID=UPI001422C477|nr:multimeric flavodoxin WrbA [Amycolatopsis granulosa]